MGQMEPMVEAAVSHATKNGYIDITILPLASSEEGKENRVAVATARKLLALLLFGSEEQRGVLPLGRNRIKVSSGYRLHLLSEKKEKVRDNLIEWRQP
jgi:hypothetical protein